VRQLLANIAFSWRKAVRELFFTLTVILLLGLGIGGSTAMFSVVDRVLLRPFSFVNSDRIVFIEGAAAPPNGDRLAWWTQAKSLAAIGTCSSGGANLTAAGQSQRIRAAAVSAGFFSVFQVEPTVGRVFIDDDERPGRSRVAVLSYSFAIRNYGSEGAAFGQNLTLNGLTYAVIGVMPTRFNFLPEIGVWIPKPLVETSLNLGSDDQSDLPILSEALIGRLQADVSLRMARTEMNALLQRLKDVYRDSGVEFGDSVKVISLQEWLVAEFRPALLALLVGVTFLFVIACADAAILLLARAAVRQKEVAIRLCLGASRVQLVRQLVVESLLLTMGSGCLGVFLAVCVINIIPTIAPPSIPYLPEIGINKVVLAFALGTSILTGTLMGLIPALETLNPNINPTLKEEGGRSIGVPRQRFRKTLVICQVSLVLALMNGTALMVQTLRRLGETTPGFDPHNVLTLRLTLPEMKYAPRIRDHRPFESKSYSQNQQQAGAGESRLNEGHEEMPLVSPNARIRAFQTSLLDRLRNIPGVSASGFVNELPLTSTGRYLAFDIAKIPSPEMAAFFYVAGDYFHVMEIPLLRGRPFAERDNDTSSPVLIINEMIARKFWGTRNPIGDHILIEGEPTAREIVGLVGNVKHRALGEPTESQIYLPWLQPYGQQRFGHATLNMALVFRTASDPRIALSIARHEVISLDPDLPVFRAKTMDEIIFESTAPPRFRTLLLGSFAAIALILTVLGIYAVVTYSVTCRTHEIGVRVSLGARSRDIWLLFVREGAMLAIIGGGIGVAGALGLNRLISSLLFGVSATDPYSLATSATVILAASFVASSIPAIRASKTDPIAALRYE